MISEKYDPPCRTKHVQALNTTEQDCSLQVSLIEDSTLKAHIQHLSWARLLVRVVFQGTTLGAENLISSRKRP
jgi:hypothetical protein